MRILKLICILWFGVQVNLILAQKLNRGTITYQVADFDISQEMLGKGNNANMKEMKAMMEPMIKGFTQTMAWDGDLQVTELNMGGLSSTKVFTDLSKNQNATFMNLMGQKYKITSILPDSKTKNASVNPKEFKSIRKKIAGYDCYKVTYMVDLSGVQSKTPDKQKTKASSKVELVAYITDKIKPSAYLSSTQGAPLNGMPLEFSMETQGMKLKLVAKDVKPTIEKSFMTQPKGYQEMTQAEFEKKMKTLGKGKQ